MLIKKQTNKQNQNTCPLDGTLRTEHCEKDQMNLKKKDEI